MKFFSMVRHHRRTHPQAEEETFLDEKAEDVVADLLHGGLHRAQLFVAKDRPAVGAGEGDEGPQN